jgi:hypothetical protein
LSELTCHLRLTELLDLIGLAGTSPSVRILGADPVLPFRYPLAEASAEALGACGAAATALWARITGGSQAATVDVREAAVALDAYRRLEIFGAGPIAPPVRDVLSSPVQAADDRWIHLNGSQAHFRDATLHLLGCVPEEAEVRAAVRRWQSFALEERLAELGVPAAVYRTGDEWASHPQGQQLLGTPLIEIEHVASSPPRSPIPVGTTPDRPLTGTRVLDLSRVLAGPTAAKMLASFGASVLRLSRPGIFEEPAVLIDTGFGKRSAFLDLGHAGARRTLGTLVHDADVFIENTRWGGMARNHAGVAELTSLRPGLIYVSVSCYGHTGPWRERRGYEPHADAVTGLRTLANPCLPPDPFFRTVSDYTTGWLASLGAMGALYRRSVEGGSYHVRVSLARTSMWVQSHAMVDATRATDVGDPGQFMTVTETPFGRLWHCRAPVRLSDSPTHWLLPPYPLGAHPPQWWS